MKKRSLSAPTNVASSAAHVGVGEKNRDTLFHVATAVLVGHYEIVEPRPRSS